jgi:hypothetical protein
MAQVQRFQRYPGTWHKTFCGITQQHNYRLYETIDLILWNNEIARFVEIGTGAGALTIFLALHAIRCKTNLLTVELHPQHSESTQRIFDQLGVELIVGNVFDERSRQRIKEHIGSHATFLFCDGGAKGREFNEFAPTLPPDSIIAAHDWTDEIQPDEIEATVKSLSLGTILEDRWVTDDAHSIRTCFYRIPPSRYI